MVRGCTGCIFWACCARSWLFTWRICISTELISTRSTIAVPLTAWWQSHRHGFLTFFVENPDSFTDFAIVLPTLVGRRLAATMAGRSDIFVAKSAGWLVVVGTGHARDTSAARWLFLRQPCRAGWFWLPLLGSCCGTLLPPWMAEMPVYSLRSPFGPACGCYFRWSLCRSKNRPLLPHVRRGVSLQSSLAR